MATRRTPLPGLLLVLAACGGDSEDGATAPASNPGPSVAIVVDGQAVRSVSASSLGARRCLPELLPEAAREPTTWVMLEV
ncbi:MAG: hypothetical protein ACYTGN_16725, partial [Planctomycetota bacterium]